MRYAGRLMVLALMTGCVAASLAQSDSAARSVGKKRIAIVGFETTGDWVKSQLGQVIADMLITELVKQGSVEIIERGELEALLKEQDLAAKGILDPETAAKSGKIMGVDYILGGRVTEAGFTRKDSGGFATVIGVNVEKATARVKLDTRLIEVQTGRIITVATGEGEQKGSGVTFLASDFNRLFVGGRFNTKEWESSMLGKASRKAVAQAVKPYLDLFPVEFAVLAVTEDGGLVIAGGKLQGLSEGQELALVRLVRLKDSKGNVVFDERVKFGRIKLENVQQERSKAKVLSGSPKEGDLATPKTP